MDHSIVFFGSSAYSVPVLQTLLDNQIPISLVVTTKDKPVGRHLKLTPNPLKQFALEKILPITEKFKDLDIRDNFVGLVAAFGRIIPQEVLDKFNTRIYNIHPSLLPKYRGPSPLQTQILDGLTETGVTIIQLDEEMDHGPIITQEKSKILDTDTPETLGERLFIQGTNMFIVLLKSWSLGKLDQLEIQNDSQVTYTHKLTRQDGFIPYYDFLKQLKTHDPQLFLKFRAYFPWPGIWSTTPEGKRIKLVSINPNKITEN